MQRSITLEALFDSKYQRGVSSLKQRGAEVVGKHGRDSKGFSVVEKVQERDSPGR
jgi:hypothetical protein